MILRIKPWLDIVCRLVADGSGLDYDSGEVIESYGNAPGKQGLYATVLRLPSSVLESGTRRYTQNVQSLGWGTIDFPDGPPLALPDEDHLYAELSTMVATDFSLQWFRQTATRSPFDAAVGFRLWCRSVGGLQRFKTDNLQFVTCSPVEDMSILRPRTQVVRAVGQWERRAGCRLRLAYVQRLVEVVGTVGEVSVLLNDDPERVVS